MTAHPLLSGAAMFEQVTPPPRSVRSEERETFWTCARSDERTVVLAGLGAEVLYLRATEQGAQLEASWKYFAMGDRAHTRRLVAHVATGNLVHARSDGDLVVTTRHASRRLARLDAAVLDAAVVEESWSVLGACEDGSLHHIDLETGERTGAYRAPAGTAFESLACEPRHRTVALFDRAGALHLVDTATMARFELREGIGRPRRARWLSSSRLVIASGGELLLYDTLHGTCDAVVGPLSGVIEDFDWDLQGRQLAVLTSDGALSLYDLGTFAPLRRASLGLARPRGVAWLSFQKADPSLRMLIAFGSTGAIERAVVHQGTLQPAGRMHLPFTPSTTSDLGLL